MSIQRIWAMFVARNYEFFRDKAAFGWNFAFPFLLIIGFGLIFSGGKQQQFKVGVFPVNNFEDISSQNTIPPSFLKNEHFTFLPFSSRPIAEQKLKHHKVDLLLDAGSTSHAYWINDSSPNGYLAEQLFLLSLSQHKTPDALKGTIQGDPIRYIDWFFPGIMAMNMMFSALWGVGYIVVRYRKNGTLKRLKATPLTPFEYLTSQMLSRIFLLMFTFAVVWLGSDMIFHFQVKGSYVLLTTIFFLGGLSLCSLGLILAARGTSEEFTSGILNFISWPMMFLSEVWFSLEGSPQWIQTIAKLLPLTHLLTAARKVMNEGATWAEVQSECMVLILITAFSLTLAAFLFSWNE